MTKQPRLKHYGIYGLWLVLWNIWIIFHFIYGMSSFPLTNSIIFQDAKSPPTRSTVVFFSPFFDHFPAGFTVSVFAWPQTLDDYRRCYETCARAADKLPGRRIFWGGSKSPSWIQWMYDDGSILFYIQTWSS